jgi:hypothetical protein
MQYIKGTKAQVEAYNEEVTTGEGLYPPYHWSHVWDIEGHCYCTYSPDYPTELEKVDSRPNED